MFFFVLYSIKKKKKKNCKARQSFSEILPKTRHADILENLHYEEFNLFL